MSNVMKKTLADKMAFKYNPKAISVVTSQVAKDFVHLQDKKTQGTDFQIADIVSQQTGVEALRKKNLEIQVEDTVLDRLKEMEEQAYRQAYNLGMIEGTEKAFAANMGLFVGKLEILDQQLSSLQKMKTDILKESETQIVRLVYQIAARIAMREIKLRQDPIVEMLSELVAEVQGAERIFVKLNPEDVKFIEYLREKKVKEVEQLDQVKIQAAEEISSGGCLISTNYGEIDGTIEQRVARAWEALMAKLPVMKKDDGSI